MKQIESPQLRSPLRSFFRLLELLDPSLIPTQQAGEFFDGAFGPSYVYQGIHSPRDPY